MDWCRLYSEMPDDPKIGTLNDAEFRTWTELLCLAAGFSSNGNTGVTEASVDWRLRRNVTETLPTLLQKQLIHYDDSGFIIITKWTERQKRSDSSADRVRRHREENKKNQSITENVTNRNDDVTLQKRYCNALEEKRVEKKERKRTTIVVPKTPIDQVQIEMVSEWADKNISPGVNRERELLKFKNHEWRKKKPTDGVKAFQNWLLKAVEFLEKEEKTSSLDWKDRPENRMPSPAGG